jgi:hypothetical protein
MIFTIQAKVVMHQNNYFADVLVKHFRVFWHNGLRCLQALGEGMASLVFTNQPTHADVCGDIESKRLRPYR